MEAQVQVCLGAVIEVQTQQAQRVVMAGVERERAGRQGVRVLQAGTVAGDRFDLDRHVAVSAATGAIEAQGGLLPALLSSRRFRFSIAALTVGHVIFGPDRDSLRRCRDHEHVHIRQYERWGPFLPPLYLLSSAAALLRGRDPYRDNRFEQEAFRLSDPSDGPQGQRA